MRGSDRVLVGIIAGVVLLVGAAVVLALTRPAAEHLPDDTPAGVAYNYPLALQKGDYERAYGYLSPSLACYPASVTEFSGELGGTYYYGEDIEAKSWSVEQKGSTGAEATVYVVETYFHRSGLFESQPFSTNFYVDLVRTAQGWRIVDAGQYFNRWRWPRGCE
jgi:hypothetical protein